MQPERAVRRSENAAAVLRALTAEEALWRA